MFTPFLTGLVLGNCLAGLWLVAGAQFLLPDQRRVLRPIRNH
jgi:hypothetical protein